MPGKRTCPQCGTERTDDAMSGLCPKCLARYSFLELEGEAGAANPPANPAETIRIDPGKDVEIERPGMMIGRYKLLEQIGEGGFGMVYMAEQVEPMQRKVALKVIKAGMDTKAVVARFEAERQALALMDHPNIARVLDAGTTKAGRPYFVMELVRGVAITEFCDQKKLSTPERLELFMTVCHAVQHAHQKGVIHRDIKPGNVLVTLHDGKPVPKVIDFGVAKALGQRLTEKTLFTGFAQMIGTPAYMSPEQAEMSGLDVDTRSDIYSLGVLLYELLIGVTPFDRDTLAKAALDEIRQMIRETKPLKPSTRLQTLGEELPGVAQSRHTDAPKLVHLVKGDLDWIVMKCLEKDRARRYDTANGLAMDIKRHLANEPVAARPPSKLYEFQKTVRRHKFGFAAAGALIMVLALGIMARSLEAQRARRAEREQFRLRQIAESKEKKSEQVSQFLKDMLEGVGPSVALGRDTTMLREILDQTAERVDKDLKEQPEVEAELSYTLGEVYFALGEYRKAVAAHRRALELRKRTLGEVDEAVTLSMSHLGRALLGVREFREAEELLRQALSDQRNKPGHKPEDLLFTLKELSVALNVSGRASNRMEAETLSREALTVARKLYGQDSVEVADTLEHLGEVLRHLSGTADEALRAYREAVEIRRKSPKDQLGLARSLMLLEGLLQSQDKAPEAEAIGREALAIQRKLYPKGHPELANTLHHLARALQRQGRPGEAEPLLREAVTIWKKVHRGGSGPTATSLLFLGLGLQSEGKQAEAESVLREALAMRSKLYGEEAPTVGRLLSTLFSLLVKEGKIPEARHLMREMLEPVSSDHAAAADSLTDLVMVRSSQGKLAEADAVFREGGDWSEDYSTRTNATLARALIAVGNSLRWRDGTADETGKVLLEGYEILKKNGYSTRGMDTFLLGVALRERGDMAEAERFLRQAMEDRGKIEDDAPYLLHPLQVLAELLQAQGRMAEAEALYCGELANRKARSGENHPTVAACVFAFAEFLGSNGRLDEACALAEQELSKQEELLGKDDSRIAVWGISLGKLLQAQSKSSEAAALFRKGAEYADLDTLNGLAWPMATSPNATDRDGPTAVLLAERAVAATARTNYQIMDTLAAAYAEAGQFTNAVRVQRETIALIPASQMNLREDFASRLRLFESNAPYREYWREANRLQTEGKLAEAESLLREQLAMYRRMVAAGHPRIAGSLASLTQVMVEEGKFMEAEPLARECVRIREKKLPDHWLTFNAQSLLGSCLLGEDEYEKAEPLLLSGYKGMKQHEGKIPGAGRVRLNEAAERLAQLYEAWGKPNKAAEWRAKQPAESGKND